MSNKIVGKVLKLFISIDQLKQRISKEEIHLDSNGVIDDKFYGKNISRSVLLSSTDSYEIASKNNIKLDYGLLGENILLDFNPYKLDMGTKLTIGTAIVEITQECTICNHLSILDEKLPILLQNDRGIFVRVVQDGIIKINDTISII